MTRERAWILMILLLAGVFVIAITTFHANKTIVEQQHRIEQLEQGVCPTR